MRKKSKTRSKSKKTAKKKVTSKKTAKKTAKKKATKKKAAKKTSKKKAVKKKASKKRTTNKKVAKKKTVKKKATKKTAAKKKVVKKKAAAKKKTTKKKTAKKKATKKAATKKKVAKKASAKPKKAAARKKTTANKKAARKIPAAKAAPAAKTGAPKTKAPEQPDLKVENEEQQEVVPKITGVVRIAGGSGRRANARRIGKAEHAQMKAPLTEGVRLPSVAPMDDFAPKEFTPKVEINPRLESSKHVLKGPAPKSGNVKPMSVAQKKRAEAEAMFAQFKKPDSEPPPPPPPPSGGSGPFGGSSEDEFGEYRVSRRDSLTTMLRLAETQSQMLEAAEELADRYQLPPDQSLLLKVVSLGDERLTKLALEELLELDDRGRVRPTPELRSCIDGVNAADEETEELKQLFLQKIG